MYFCSALMRRTGRVAPISWLFSLCVVVFLGKRMYNLVGKEEIFMNQQKTGEFLKHLRKEKGLTQEQLAERFYVSSRTISRWETGSNMPDVDMLIELADFYDVDIREIINGDRKSENMNNETKDTLKKVAEYVAEESKKRKEKLRTMLAGSTILMLICYLLFGIEHKGRLNGIIPANICADIMSFAIGFAIATLALYGLYCLGAFDKISQWKKNRGRNAR